MAAKEDSTNKRPGTSIFSFKGTHSLPSSDSPKGKVPTGSTSAEDTRGILNRKDGIHNFGVALELLKTLGDGNELLAPLKAVCGGLKILVDTAAASDCAPCAIQQNDEDLRDLNTRLRRQLDALEQQDKTLLASELNVAHNETGYFVKSLTMYILDLNKVQKVLDTLRHKEGVSVKKLFKKALMTHSVREEIKGCNRQLDESFQLFMNSVTGFIAHQAVLLRNDIAEMRVRVDEKKVNDALSQLPCSDARGNQHDSCLEGTREDILKEITEWATNATDKPIFCLVGQAGTGKSTISTHMVRQWDKEGALIGRFFFSLPNAVTNANELPTTLARDMANSSSSLRLLILDAINERPNIKGHSIKEKLEWFVFTPLKRWRDGFVKGLEEVRAKMQEKAYTQGPENIHSEIIKRSDIMAFEASYRQALGQARKEPEDGSYKGMLEDAYMAYMEVLEKAYMNVLARSPIIVMDALDECAIVDRGILLKSILGFLEEASLNDSHPLMVFLTCRPEGDLLSHLQEPRHNDLIHRAVLGMQFERNSPDHDDIRRYANQYLDQVLSAAEIDLFVIRANGLFIWASTARTFLTDALDPSTRFEHLIAPKTKSSPLHSLYDQILRSAINKVGRDQVRLLKHVLQGVCVAREPLNARAMDELLGLSNDVARRVVNTLRSVLSDGTDNKAVQALHPTFIEYFRAGSQPSDIWFSDGEAETLLAGGCLDALSSPQLCYDICGVMGQDRLVPQNQDLEGLQRRLEEKTSPGLRYAAAHGLSHVAVCLGDREVVTKLREFFMSKLLYWIELMSLIGSVYHLMQSIHHLKSQIEDGMKQSTDLLSSTDKNWCEETHRIVQPFQAAIEKSALQVYFSALPFAPSTGQIFHFYHQTFVDRTPKVLHGTLRMQPQYTVLSGHTDWVQCLAFSPDGRQLASGSDDNTVRLWDTTTGAALGEPLIGHTGDVTCLSFSPDGRRLASGSYDHTVRLWDVTTGAAFGEPLIGHTNAVTCLFFSHQSQQLASGSNDGTIWLWDATTGATRGESLIGHTGDVTCLSFSPDGRRLASGSYDNTVRLWDATTRAALGEPLIGHTNAVTCLSFSRQSQQLASGSKDGTIWLWDATTGAALGKPLIGHTHAVTCVSFSLDGRRLASGSHDDTVRLWDATTGAALGEPPIGHTGTVTCVSFSPDGRQLASGSWDQTLRLWDATTATTVGRTQIGHNRDVSCLSFSSDGRRLASGSYDNTVRLWDATTGAPIGEPLIGHTRHVTCLSFTPDGRKLASGSFDQTVRLWDLVTGVTIDKPVRHDSHVWSLCFHVRDESLFLTINDGSDVWKIAEDALVKLGSEPQFPGLVDFYSESPRFDAPWTYIRSLTGFHFSLPSSFRCTNFASHGGMLAYGGADGSVIIIDCSHL